MRSEEDVAFLEEELDTHVHVICGVQVGTMSPRGREAWHSYPPPKEPQPSGPGHPHGLQRLEVERLLRTGQGGHH